MSVLENNANRSSSSVISHPQVQDHESEQEDSDEDERLSVAPGSQEGELSSGEEAETPVQVSQSFTTFCSCLVSHNPVINDLKRIGYMVGLRETSM
jgi:hypothetical protein